MSLDTHYVGRLAPSPTGALHLGNARTFLVAWLRARSAGGRLILRMEDLDHPKVKPNAARQAYDDLRWLGLDWDEGPDVGGPHAPYVQTQRLPLYHAALRQLIAAQRLYPCVCTRADVLAAQSAPHEGEELRYPNTCRGRFSSWDAALATSPKSLAWRFQLRDGMSRFVDGLHGEQLSDPNAWSGDFVVARGFDQPAYQLAVVVDDAAMGVTEVVRGDDLLLSTHRQLALYEALGLTPPTFFHVPLVVGPDGKRLAKRHGDTRIAAFRDAGVPPQQLVGWLAQTLGLAIAGEPLTASDVLHRFQNRAACGTHGIPRQRVSIRDLPSAWQSRA